MRDVIARIIEAEAEATQLLDTARAEADRLAAEASRKARDTTERIQAETRMEVDRLLETSQHHATLEKQKELERLAAQCEREIRLDPATRIQAVSDMLECVCPATAEGETR